MNFYQRALRYIQRTPTKTLLLVLTFFLIGNLVILGLGVSQASDNAKILTRKKMRAVVSYEVDYNAFWQYADSIEDADEQMEAYRNTPRIDKDTAIQISADKRVTAFNYFQNLVVYGKNGLEHVLLGNENSNEFTYVDENGNTVQNVQPGFMMFGNLTPDMIELKEGTYEIKEGRLFNQQDIDLVNNVCLITEELASANNLRPGDTITVSSINPNEVKNYVDAGISEEELDLELEIIGIYSTVEEVDPNSDEFRWMSPFQSPKNKILIPFSALSAYSLLQMENQMEAFPEQYRDADLEMERSYREMPDRVVYLLDDPMHVDSFVEDYRSSLGEFQILNANNETFLKMARPLDTMSFFANILVWVVVINAVVIISLVTALTLKTREYEIGVLLSIGVSKMTVVVQLFLELLIIAFIGFGLASVSGSMMAGKVGNIVLDYQTTSDAKYGDAENGYSYFDSSSYFTQVTQDDLLSEYHVSVSPLLIFEIFVLGTVVVLVAIVIPTAMIMRLNPKQILLS